MAVTGVRASPVFLAAVATVTGFRSRDGFVRALEPARPGAVRGAVERGEPAARAARESGHADARVSAPERRLPRRGNRADEPTSG